MAAKHTWTERNPHVPLVLVFSFGSAYLVQGFVSSKRAEYPPPAWFTQIEELSVIPAEYSVAGSVLVASLAFWLAIVRWRRPEP